MNLPVVQMSGITKGFPGVVANAAVDFSIKAGEIHALLGENGSGKSTLMSILAGLYRPDSGKISVRGQEVIMRSPRDAINLGIGVVHQHFKLVDTFTVAENIILGDRAISLIIKNSDIKQKIKQLSDKYGLEVDPGAKVHQLSVGEKQKVEILKMLYRGVDILILDEPTAVLTPQEATELFANLKKMTAGGRSVVLITHKLNEVMAVADRVSVLRSGRMVATRAIKEVNEKELSWLMVGRDIKVQSKGFAASASETVLELKGVNASSDLGTRGIRGVSFTLGRGEILGVAGVAGNGQKELAEAIVGLRWVSSGRIILNGREITNISPRTIKDSGVSYVPEDRLGMGLVPGLGAVDNLILRNYRDNRVSGRWTIRKKESAALADELIKQFDIKLASPWQPVKALSGGNMQKLLLAREISADPLLIVVVYPARGLDVGATEGVHRLLLEQSKRGAAILLISEDLDEIFKLSDNIAVFYEGILAGIVPRGQANVEGIGLMMMGGRIGGEA